MSFYKQYYFKLDFCIEARDLESSEKYLQRLNIDRAFKPRMIF